jgi:hypothetical protein
VVFLNKHQHISSAIFDMDLQADNFVCLPNKEVDDGGGDELEQRVEEGQQGRPEHVQPKTPHYIPGPQVNLEEKYDVLCQNRRLAS